MPGARRQEQGRGGLCEIGPAQSASGTDAGLDRASLRCCLDEWTLYQSWPSALIERRWIVRHGNRVHGDYDARRGRGYKATLPTIAATAVRAVIVPSPVPRGLWSDWRNIFRPLFRGKCRSEAHLVRKRNTIGLSAKHPISFQSLVRQGVSDPGCVPGARAPKNGPCGSAPPKMALACARRPFGEVAPGILPCRKAARPEMAHPRPLLTRRSRILSAVLRSCDNTPRKPSDSSEQVCIAFRTQFGTA